MLKSLAQNSAISKDALSSDAPFIIYRLPGGSEAVYVFSGIEYDGRRLSAPGIELNTWLGRTVPHMDVCSQSTTSEEYREAIGRTVADLGKNGGKTVICRVICGEFRNTDLPSMLEEYFARFPEMFCFCAYHPLTGCWMGASPELLLQRHSDGSAATRALAGTRRQGSAKEWDIKNIEEHRFVIDDICSRAASLPGYRATPGTTDTLAYGAIEHLATPITIEAPGGTDLRLLIDAIHPTAAIAGYPLEKALSAIEDTEKEQRRFYGGTIIAGDTAYVVLRCAHFDARHWCIYTGSGITARSGAEDEWLETEEKARPLLSLLSRY